MLILRWLLLISRLLLILWLLLILRLILLVFWLVTLFNSGDRLSLIIRLLVWTFRGSSPYSCLPARSFCRIKSRPRFISTFNLIKLNSSWISLSFPDNRFSGIKSSLIITHNPRCFILRRKLRIDQMEIHRILLVLLILWMSLPLSLIRSNILTSISRRMFSNRIDPLIDINQILIPHRFPFLIFFEGDVHRLLLRRLWAFHWTLFFVLSGVGWVGYSIYGLAVGWSSSLFSSLQDFFLPFLSPLSHIFRVHILTLVSRL